MDEFGEEVLAAPTKSGFNLVAWLLPLAGLLAAIVGVTLARPALRRARGPSLRPRPGRRSTPSSSAASTKSSTRYDD